MYKSYLFQVFYDALKIKSFLWFWLLHYYNSASYNIVTVGKNLFNLLLEQDSVGGIVAVSVVVVAAAAFVALAVVVFSKLQIWVLMMSEWKHKFYLYRIYLLLLMMLPRSIRIRILIHFVITLYNMHTLHCVGQLFRCHGNIV